MFESNKIEQNVHNLKKPIRNWSNQNVLNSTKIPLVFFFLPNRITSPLDQSYDFRNSSMSVNCLSPTSSRPTKHWITVYGFSPSTTSVILNHFAQCGTILEKVFPSQSGNWMHLRYASSLECEKALNYHERILANSVMIGVTYCKDPNIERNK